MSTRAFIGEPADARGNALPCACCDRRARLKVGAEPRCMRHATASLPLEQQREADAARRARLRERLERR